MNTYDNSYGISGLDWQTAFNRSSSAPSFRETEGMAKATDSFYEGQIHTVDAVFCEGYLRGLNYALRILQQEIRIPATTYKKAYKNLGHSIDLKRKCLLAEHGVSPADDEALHSSTPFIDELGKKSEKEVSDNLVSKNHPTTSLGEVCICLYTFECHSCHHPFYSLKQSEPLCGSFRRTARRQNINSHTQDVQVKMGVSF